MKAAFASILLLLLISASFWAGVHAAGVDPSTAPHAQTSGDGHGPAAECCEAGGHEMSESCFMPVGLAADVATAAPPLLMKRASRPAAATPVTPAEPSASAKPPRTL